MKGENSQDDHTSKLTVTNSGSGPSSPQVEFDAFVQRLPPANRIKLMQRSKTLTVLRDQVIVRQGDPGRFYYIIRRGRMAVTQAHSGNIQRHPELHAGDRFGEEALITGQPQPRSVTACQPGEIVRIDKEDFLELLLAPILCVVNLTNAQRLARNGARWLDARATPGPTPSFISQAVPITAQAIRQANTADLDSRLRYLVFCNDGSESALATFLLAERGFQVAYLAGGLGIMSNSQGRLHARPQTDRHDAISAPAADTAEAEERTILTAETSRREDRHMHTKSQRLPPQLQRNGVRSELLAGSPAERNAIQQRREALLMQRLRTDVERWRTERADYESSPEQRHRSTHLAGLMDAIKRRANAARIAAKQHDQSLLDEISALLDDTESRKS